MANIDDLQLMDDLFQLPISVFTIADLAKLIRVKKSGLRTVISRLKKKGILTHLGRGLYGVRGKPVVPEEVAARLYYPSYLSLKTVLSKAGVINQIPQKIYCVTLKKSYQTKMIGVPIIYRQIKDELFFGFYLDQKIPIAYPEKALLDLLYFVSLGRETVSIKELYLKNLNYNRWKKFKKHYPKRIGKIAKQVSS